MADVYDPHTLERVLDWVRAHPLPDGRPVPVCVWGARGTGKTVVIRSYCAKRKLGFRGFHPAHNNSGSDLIGLPMIEQTSGRTIYARPKWLPSENDAVVWDRAGLIFIDEINRSPKEVLAGLMEPLGEGTLEQSGWKLPEGWGFVCAANPPRAGYDVDQLDEAVMDRMLHIALGFDEVSWASWATGSGISEDVVGFVGRFPGLMADTDTDLPKEIKIQATPRSMEYLSRLYEPGMDPGLLHILARGLIGDRPADALLEHLRGSDRPITGEQVFSDPNFAERLAAHAAAGRGDLLDASQMMLLAMLARFQPDRNGEQLSESGERQLRQLLTYVQTLPAERAGELLQEIRAKAPHWLPDLERALGRRIPAQRQNPPAPAPDPAGSAPKH